ncbi:hypothetical protein BdWA1_000328 [Babesia duncani]|uniref:Uncharacterized protein n=1 Tax=Babesia duncani TaxID=323732 RepID=A0AAD9PM89_9APIC|nr:hypothetical protein BdWA1_000328 [Babesia duncani]
MDRNTEVTRPYLDLFSDTEVITRDDLVGDDLPFGLVPRVRFELWKLCGKIADPAHPISSQSITTKLFVQRLFGGKREIDRNEFNYKIDYEFKFLAPGYGDVFFMDKVRCWRAWLLWRNLEEGREEMPDYGGDYPILRKPNEVPLSLVIHRVNSEVNRLGVHPALLDMLWEFFTPDPEILHRDLVIYKFNAVIDKLEGLDPAEGIPPDAFYYLFHDAAKGAIEAFDKDTFVRNQMRIIERKNLHQQLLSNNKAIRIRNKLLTKAYSEELKSLYKVPIPISYRRYERRRLGAYYKLKADNWARQQRRRFQKIEPTTTKTATKAPKSTSSAPQMSIQEKKKEKKQKQKTDKRRSLRMAKMKKRFSTQSHNVW